MTRYLKSKKILFFSVLIAGFLPVLASISYYLWGVYEIEKKQQLLDLKKNEIAEQLIKNGQNIKIHKAFMNAFSKSQKALLPLKYNEGPFEKQTFIKECLLTQKDICELTSNEIKNLLLNLDNSSKPQLLVLDFSLKRDPSLDGEDKFKIQTKLLKREFE